MYRWHCGGILAWCPNASTSVPRQVQPCPRGWWGHPTCGPCSCDVTHGFDPDCNKTTGECRCKVGPASPCHLPSNPCLPPVTSLFPPATPLSSHHLPVTTHHAPNNPPVTSLPPPCHPLSAPCHPIPMPTVTLCPPRTTTTAHREGTRAIPVSVTPLGHCHAAAMPTLDNVPAKLVSLAATVTAVTTPSPR